MPMPLAFDLKGMHTWYTDNLNEQDLCIFSTWSMALYFLVARVGTSFYLLYFISSD
jgi:hypothetical protein